jgi:hypothetical protein
MQNPDGSERICKCRWKAHCRHGDVCVTPNTNSEAKPLCYASTKKPFKLKSNRGRHKK